MSDFGDTASTPWEGMNRKRGGKKREAGGMADCASTFYTCVKVALCNPVSYKCRSFMECSASPVMSLGIHRCLVLRALRKS